MSEEAYSWDEMHETVVQESDQSQKFSSSLHFPYLWADSTEWKKSWCALIPFHRERPKNGFNWIGRATCFWQHRQAANQWSKIKVSGFLLLSSVRWLAFSKHSSIPFRTQIFQPFGPPSLPPPRTQFTQPISTVVRKNWPFLKHPLPLAAYVLNAAMAEGWVLFKGHQKFSKKEHYDRFCPQNTEHLTTFLHKITGLNLCLAW